MKRLLLLVLAIVVVTPVFASQDNGDKIEVRISNIEIIENATTSGAIVDFLVYSNAALDDLCSVVQDYNKWVSLYCKWGKAVTPVVCTISKIVNVVCETNHTVRLFVEGDIPRALYSMINSDLTYELAKMSAGKYSLTLPQQNMTPRSEWY